MKIVKMNGGLGNQVFQYIFMRAIEEIGGEKCIVDDSDFTELDGSIPMHNGYELEKIWNIKVDLLSNHFSEDVYNEMIKMYKDGMSIPQQLKNNGIDLAVVAETGDFSFDGNVIYIPANICTPNVGKSRGNIYYHGYWICKGWFNIVKEKILEELKFPPILDSKNIEYENKILNSESIAVHIRRGDFVTLGWNLPIEYYYNSMKTVAEKFCDRSYFIFSDDIKWCKDNFDKLGFNFAKGKIVFVEGNCDKRNNYIDLQLMSICKGMIMSNSSFCYLAAILNQNENKIIVNPTSREI